MCVIAAAARAQDSLPSWKEGASKSAVTSFVTRVTTEGSRDFVKPSGRIAVFDNDGTLWAEQPICFQFLFAVDRVRALAPQHPEWNDKEPFKSLLAGDMKAVLAGGEKNLMEVVAAAHSGMTGDLQMLQWTTQGAGRTGPRFAMIIHHTDAQRESAYDRESHVGRLDKVLDEAAKCGWTVVDMKRDWNAVFSTN